MIGVCKDKRVDGEEDEEDGVGIFCWGSKWRWSIRSGQAIMMAPDGEQGDEVEGCLLLGFDTIWAMRKGLLEPFLKHDYII